MYLDMYLDTRATNHPLHTTLLYTIAQVNKKPQEDSFSTHLIFIKRDIFDLIYAPAI